MERLLARRVLAALEEVKQLDVFDRGEVSSSFLVIVGTQIVVTGGGCGQVCRLLLAELRVDMVVRVRPPPRRFLGRRHRSALLRAANIAASGFNGAVVLVAGTYSTHTVGMVFAEGVIAPALRRGGGRFLLLMVPVNLVILCRLLILVLCGLLSRPKIMQANELALGCRLGSCGLHDDASRVRLGALASPLLRQGLLAHTRVHCATSRLRPHCIQGNCGGSGLSLNRCRRSSSFVELWLSREGYLRGRDRYRSLRRRDDRRVV